MKKQVGLLGIATAAIMVSAMTGPLEDGQAFLADGNPRAAMIRFELALKEDPSNLEARLGLAQSLLEMGELDRAEKMARVVARRAEGADATLVLAESLYAQGRFSEARASLSGDSPDERVDALRTLIDAETAFENGDGANALKTVAPIIDHDQFGAQALYLAARSQYARGDYGRAQLLTDRLLERKAESAPTRLLQARIKLDIGDPGAAGKIADDLLEKTPGNIAAGAIAVEAALLVDDSEKAWAVQRSLVPVSTDDPRPAYLAALINLHEGRVDDAAEAVARVEASLVDIPGGAALLGQISNAQGHLAQSESLLRARLGSHPRDWAARKVLIDVYDLKGEPQRGDDILDQAVGYSGADPAVQRFKAKRLMARGELDAAQEIVASLARAEGRTLSIGQSDPLALPTGDVSSTLVSAVTSLDAADPEQALEAARAAMEASDHSPVSRNIYAAALARNGQKAEAEKELASLISQYPDYYAAISNLASLDGREGAEKYWLEIAEGAGAQSATVLSALAQEYFVAGEMEKASALSARGHAAAKAKTDEQLRHPRLLIAMGDSEEAVAVLETVAEEIGPSDFAFALAVSQLLQVAGDPEDAAAILTPYATPTASSQIVSAATSALINAGESDKAWQIILATRDNHPADRNIHQLYLEQLARRDLSRAMSLVEGDGILKVRLMHQAGKTGEALSLLAKSNPNPELFAVWAEMVESEDQKVVLVDTLEKWIANNPRDRQSLLILSGMATDIGRIDAAEAAASKGLALSPNDPFFLNNLALARAERQPKEALDLARRAYNTLPELSAFAETYAALLTKNGQNQKAHAVLRRAIIVDPGNSALRTALAH